MTGHLKSLNQTELADFLGWAFPQVQGAQLQDVWTDGTGVALDLYAGGLFQIWMDLRPGKVFLVLLQGPQIRKRQKVQKPLVLFLNSHTKNLRLVKWQLKKEMGRVVEFEFSGGEKSSRLEFTMIPNALNLQVESEGKTISWAKPKDLEAQTEETQFPIRYESWEDFCDAYSQWRWPRQESSKEISTSLHPLQKNWEKDLAKKQKALEKLDELIQGVLSEAHEERLRQLGEDLKWKSGPEPEQMDLWDSDLDVAGNRAKVFEQARDIRTKRQGTEARRPELVAEIESLQKKLADPASQPMPAGRADLKLGTRALMKSESKGRSLNLSSGLQAVTGKSGRDNLAILRQARAWDLWLHLKDEAAAHAILFRDKNQKVSDADIEEVGQWLYREAHSSQKSLAGGRFELLVAECRFVKPIKGDKLGRVTYQKPRVYSFVAKRNS